MTEEKVDHEQMHYRYRRLYESLGKVVVKLEDNIKSLTDKNALLEAQIKQWELSITRQQQVIQQALASSNANSQAYLDENRVLREQIRELRSKRSE